ncbi:MAG: hypothetical protein PSX79_12115 [bacterium]|nr:hypothetical protein [bacterium]
MNRTINRLKNIFVGLFLVSCAAVFAYHYMWVWPKARCEAQGRPWAAKWMRCARVYSIETITQRPLNLPPINGEKATPAAAPPVPAKK